MANSISTPSWREDAPSAEETSLAQLIGAHNPMAAANLMIPEMQRNYQAQDAYHQQMMDNNDIQRANIQQAAQEARMKGITSLLEHAQPGSLAAARSMLPDMVPGVDASAALENSLGQKAAAANAAGLGKGNEGGIVPGPGAVPQGFSVTTPGLVQAAKLNADSRVAAAGISSRAGNKSYTETSSIPDMEHPFDTTKTRTYGGGGAPAGLSGVVPMSNSVPITNVPPSLQGPITPNPSPLALGTKMQTLAATNPQGHQKVIEAAAANGGKPVLGPKSADGKGTLMGSDGVAY